ncbi:FAD-binding oxidoreductase [Acetobacteraceae bacterium H6797]|nr:FAD-binding oxidoreductase [Acetobacteraceae bacterium H6797]
MSPPVDYLRPDETLPERVDVVVIGGGIIGVSTALFLSQRGLKVAICEKGVIGGEQSSRNWGWVRVMGRDPAEIPLSVESQRLWAQMEKITGRDVGYRESGIIYLCDTDKQVAAYEEWLQHAEKWQIGSRLLSQAEIAEKLPNASRQFAGALYTENDARAEPRHACPAIAEAARALGATIHTDCAVRGLDRTGGAVSGVITEKGRIACSTVVLASGAWTRLFVGNMGLDFPQLKAKGTVLRTTPVSGLPEMAVGASDFAFRKRLDGGYSIAHRGATVADITPDTFRLFFDFLPALFKERAALKLRLGRRFFEEWSTRRSWSLDEQTPFEAIRRLDPVPDSAIVDEGLRNLMAAFPDFRKVQVAERWAGYIDTTPDAVPVMGPVPGVPGLIMASGFSGHGFGIGPGAGRLVADIVTGDPPLVDPHPYRYDRFKRTAKAA